MADRQHNSRNKSRRHDRDRSSRYRSRSRDRTRPRSRTNSRYGSRSRSRTRSRSNHYSRDQNGAMQQTLQSILARLNTLETERSPLRDATNNQLLQNSTTIRSFTPPPGQHQDNQALQATVPLSETPLPNSITTLNIPASGIAAPEGSSSDTNNHDARVVSESARILAEAIRSVNSDRTQKYFVSNFDPTIHDIDVWCEEVERARSSNNWGDSECLSRVSVCLKGDARTWLNEWVTSDRTWSSFVKEFKPLCPRKLDYANILYDAMHATSDKYSTYAEYARRTLLRLKIVKGLSDELRTLIVIRGITDPQVRAAAANANLQIYDLVSFLSTYVKPTRTKHENRNSASKPTPSNRSSSLRCFICRQNGHKSHHCPKKPKTDQTSNVNPSTNDANNLVCNFCKKPGHSEDKCFAKERSGSRNKKNINLCSTHVAGSPQNNDLKTAIIQGIPVDVLIDSGALNISLVSSEALKHFTCERKPKHYILKGISDAAIHADSFVTLTIEFDDISIEADFVVVPGSCMTTPVIIGTDILNRDGITYVRTKDRQYLTRADGKDVHAVSVSEDLQINTPLKGAELERLTTLIKKFSNYLISGTASTTVTTGKMSIKVTDSTPIAYRPYKLSHSEKLKVREIVRDLKDKGIIRESNSEYASPIILVKKKDGTDRMCVDYRALNRLTVRDRYPLPLIDDHIDRLGNFKYFTSLDMATGFHQIAIEEGSIHKTAFVTPEGHFEYLRMPYGLTNSPIVYQRIINDTLRGHIEAGNVLVYVDDVLCMSDSVGEGICLLKKVLETLTGSGFSINLRKCSFLSMEVEYLGRVVSQGQVRPSPQKIQALVEAPVPRNVKQIRQFLGLAGYFRRYIRDYATKTACIAGLMKKDVTFCWSTEQEKARQEIISCLTNSPILAIFDQSLLTEVHTDASSIGYGAVLMQKKTDGTKHVVAYFSKATQGAESRYHSYELETLAVVKALQNFRHYLVGINFKVITDCNALKATEKKKDLLPRVARWWIYLQDFNFSIDYRKGTMMTHADYLSRNPVTTKVHQISRPRNWAQIAQSADNETQGILQKLQDGELDSQQYVRQNELLYYRYTPVGEEPRLLCFIPKGHRLSLLRIFHDEHDHICAEKTVDLILKHFWFPGLRQFVAKYIKHCLVCVSYKRVPRAPHQPITSWEKPSLPFQTLHIDALGPLPESNGYKFVLLIIDAFTKFSLLYSVRKQDVSELKRTFTNAISLFGVPKLLVADRGRMFESSEFSTLLTEFGCEIHFITPEMHNANGQVERYVRTVLNMIRIETNHRRAEWSDKLWKLQLTLNITKQKTTQASALKLLVGTDATTPIVRTLIRDIAIERSENHEGWRELCRTRAHQLLTRNQAKQDSRVNQQRRAPRAYVVNDLVFVIKYSQSTGKLDPGMRGPYRVIKVLPNGRYQLKLISGSYGKTTQAAAEHMIPWNGEWCPDSCAAFFEGEY